MKTTMGAIAAACLLVSCLANDDYRSVNSDPDELAVALVGQWVLREVSHSRATNAQILYTSRITYFKDGTAIASSWEDSLFTYYGIIDSWFISPKKHLVEISQGTCRRELDYQDEYGNWNDQGKWSERWDYTPYDRKDDEGRIRFFDDGLMRFQLRDRIFFRESYEIPSSPCVQQR